MPKFDFGHGRHEPSTFEATAYVLENTGVAATRAAFNIGSAKSSRALAISPSRHVTPVRSGRSSISPSRQGGPFDEPDTAAQVLAAVTATKFIVS